jgi:hypothetical protein
MVLMGILSLGVGLAVFRWQTHRVTRANPGTPISLWRRPRSEPSYSYWARFIAILFITFGTRQVASYFHGSEDYTVIVAGWLLVLLVIVVPIVRHNRLLGR